MLTLHIHFLLSFVFLGHIVLIHSPANTLVTLEQFYVCRKVAERAQLGATSVAFWKKYFNTPNGSSVFNPGKVNTFSGTRQR